MHAILYISQETQPFSKSELQELLRLAICSNREQEITGCLHYESGFFMQYIEGDAAALARTMDRIGRDKRHQIFYRSEEHMLEEKRFPSWSMHWEDRQKTTHTAAAMSELNRTLQPFDQNFTNAEFDQAFLIYKQIAYEHVLHGMAASRKELKQIADTLSMAVHDLRSPLRAIRALIGMYVEEAGETIDPEFVEPSKYIEGSLERMDNLIDGVLGHFETDAQTVTEWVDTGLLVKEIAATAKLENKKCEVFTQINLPTIKANQLKIWRVLNCLVSNGLKYNQSEFPRVEVSAKLVGADWQFCVQDNGIGIDSAYHQQIFDMFRRLHNQSTYPGSGVGLATCQKLVEQWRGKIWVSSTESESSKFYFTYPVAA